LSHKITTPAENYFFSFKSLYITIPTLLYDIIAQLRSSFFNVISQILR